MTTLRNLLIAAGSAAVLASLATTAAAQQSTSSASATVGASIIQPIAITKNNDVSFGTITRPNTATTSQVVLSTTNTTTPVSIVGGTALVQAQGSRGQFTITGDGGRAYTLSGSTTAFNLTGSGSASGQNISFTPAFSVDSGSLSGTAGVLPGTQFTAATQLLYAGGSFNVTNETTPGPYTGTMSLTVTYN
ncbi:DUF4402 domain-containing protein [Phenylobacterium sp.]|jgi:opacity protein-like surface antigen|uniref:DUF4402 domain-containing protein n=1 Tax=Phenylobacterium sp. TaxID=1871053 RepID=UPI002F933D0E